MPLNNLYTLSAISLFPDVVADAVNDPIVIPGLRNATLALNTDVIHDESTGLPEPQYAAINETKPTARYQSTHLRLMGETLGLNGLNLAVDPLNNGDNEKGTFLYAAKKQKGGTRAGQGANVMFTALSGLAYLRSITAEHGRDALADIEMLITSDGTNPPLTSVSNADLPTIPVDNERWRLGSIVLGTTNGDKITITQKTRVSLDIAGTSNEHSGSDGDIWPTFAGINTARRMARISVLDPSLLSASGIPITGKVVNYNYTKIYFRRVLSGSSTGFFANNSEVHICFTLGYGLAHHNNLMQVQTAGNGEAEIQIPLFGDNSVPSLAVDWTSTHPN